VRSPKTNFVGLVETWTVWRFNAYDVDSWSVGAAPQSNLSGDELEQYRALNDVGDGDLDMVTSEQIDQLGVVWYENPAR